MKPMSYDEYKAEVVKIAKETYPHPICIDNIRDFYNHGESTEECAQDAICLSYMWDNAPF